MDQAQARALLAGERARLQRLLLGPRWVMRSTDAPGVTPAKRAQPSTALVDDSQHQVSGRYRAVLQVLRMESAPLQR
jgi:hypothetical protein